MKFQIKQNINNRSLNLASVTTSNNNVSASRIMRHNRPRDLFIVPHNSQPLLKPHCNSRI